MRVAGAPPSSGVGYLTQFSDELSIDSSDGISVCGSTHWFPPPGNRTVDIFVPSDWFDPESTIDPPIVPDPADAMIAKIIVCEPRNGVVQISVWGSASGRIEDVRVSVNAGTIAVDIAPDITDRPEDAVASTVP